MIKTLNISILDAPAMVVGHCCNCFHTMGWGVAKAIREKYPEVYETDCLTKKGDYDKLGRVSIAKIESPDNQIQYVANLYGQFTFSSKQREVDYEAIYTALSKVKDWMLKNNLTSVAFPNKMCCVLAGGDWAIIEAMIASVFKDTKIEVLICNYQG